MANSNDKEKFMNTPLNVIVRDSRRDQSPETIKTTLCVNCWTVNKLEAEAYKDSLNKQNKGKFSYKIESEDGMYRVVPVKRNNHV